LEDIKKIYPRLMTKINTITGKEQIHPTIVKAEQTIYKTEQPYYQALKDRTVKQTADFIRDTTQGKFKPLGEEVIITNEQMVGYDPRTITPIELVADIVKSKPEILRAEGGDFKIVPTNTEGLKFNYPIYTRDSRLISDVFRGLKNEWASKTTLQQKQLGLRTKVQPEGFKLGKQEFGETLYPLKEQRYEVPVIRSEYPVNEISKTLANRVEIINGQPFFNMAKGGELVSVTKTEQEILASRVGKDIRSIDELKSFPHSEQIKLVSDDIIPGSDPPRSHLQILLNQPRY
jgi:hypothetical protein